jgi:hypothetical protein
MNREDLGKLLFTDTAPTGSSPPDGQPKCQTLDPLVCVDEKDIIALLHEWDNSPPPIRPCDTPNPSDTTHTGQPKNYTTSRVLNNFGIISTYLLFPRMVPISTTASSPLPLEPTRQFLRLLAGKPFDVPPPNTLTWFTLISPSETACRLAVSNMH